MDSYKMILKSVQEMENVFQMMFVNAMVPLETNVKFRYVIISQQMKQVFVPLMEHV